MIIPIKKIIKYVKYIGLTLLGLAGLFSFSNATYYGSGINVPIGEYVQVSNICNDVDNANVSHYITFDKNLNIKYLENNVEYKGFKFHSCGWQGIRGYLYRNDGRLAYGGDFWTNGGDTNLIPNNVGYINNVCITTKGTMCINTGSSTLSMSDFIRVSEKRESFTIIPQPTNANAPTYGLLVICFNSTDKSYCVNYNLASNGSTMGFTHYNPTNIGQSHYDLPITDWAVYFGNSPVIGKMNYEIGNGSGVNGYDYNTVNSGDLIDYFENNPDYKFNKDICYIGTRDLVSVYEDRIPYYQGSGYTIYDFYGKLFNTNTFSVKQVGSFIDTRYINYSTWFMGENRSINGDPLYNAYYTYGSGFRLDQGSGLINPFLGNLSSYFFLGSTAYENNGYRSSTPGEAIATYCLRKLEKTNNGSPSADGSSYNIDDNHNEAYDNNTAVYIARLKNGGSYFSGPNTIVSQSRDGTPLDYFDNGENITDFSEFFSSSFNKFKSVFGDGLPVNAFGIGGLPLYITFFLLAIIFFRFLSH